MRKAQRIADTETKKIYPSMYKAGLALHELVNGSKDDSYVWYKIARTFPDRFLVENSEGKFVKVEYKSTVKAKTVKEQEFFIDGAPVKESELTAAQRAELGLDVTEEVSDEENQIIEEGLAQPEGNVSDLGLSMQQETAPETPTPEQLQALVQRHGKKHGRR